MKNIVSVISGAAAITCAIATTIANANGRFVGRAYLVPWLYALSIVLLMAAVTFAFWPSREDKLKPLVIPLRYRMLRTKLEEWVDSKNHFVQKKQKRKAA